MEEGAHAHAQNAPLDSGFLIKRIIHRDMWIPLSTKRPGMVSVPIKRYGILMVLLMVLYCIITLKFL